MPRERIGDAYVRVHADGGPIPDDLKKDFDKLAPVIRSAGQEHGKAYAEGFDKEISRQGRLNHFAQGIGKALGKFDAGSEFVQRMEVSLIELRKRVGDEHGPEIGQRLADGIQDAMQRGAITTVKEYERAISNLRPAIARITTEIDRENAAQLQKMLRDQAARLKEIERQEAETSQAILTIKQKENLSIIGMAQERARESERLAKGEAALAGQARKNFETLRDAVERYSRGVTEAGVTQHTLIVRIHELHDEMNRLQVSTSDTDREFKRFHKTVRSTIPTLDRAEHRLLGISDKMGKAFGRGSRNNFINLIGAMVRGIARFTTLAATGIIGFLTNMARGLSEVTQGIHGMAQATSTAAFKAGMATMVDGFLFMGTTAATAGLNLIALAAAVAALGTAAVIATSLISGLLAILTALVSTISFAAAAALPALVGAFLPLVAGIGVVVAAFQSLSDAQKEALKADLKPLTNAFKGLGDAAADVLFQDVGKWARQLKPLIDSLEPGVVGVAKAIRETLGNAIDNAADSPKMEHFIDRMNTFLPNAVRKLGDVFTNVFEGIGGVILAMLPTINRFLGWLQEITQEFSNWANSKSGRRELREFFKDAADSAAALGDFLKQAVKFLAELLSQSRGTGDRMFRQMANAVEDMVEWLTSPEGKAAIADWLAFGEKMFTAIGEVVVAAKDLIDTLDSPGARATVLFLIDSFRNFLKIIDLVAEGIGKIVDLLGQIKLPDLGDLGLGGLQGALSGIGGAFGGSSGKISGWGDAADAVREKILGFVSDLSGLRGTLDQVTGGITAATRAMISQKLQTQGADDLAARFGISLRELTGAALGNRGAMEKVTAAYRRARNSGDENADALKRLAQQLGISARELRTNRREIQQNTAATTKYGGKLRGLPKVVKSEIRADGIVPSVKGIAKVIAKAKELAPGLKPRQLKTIIEASGADLTRKQIQRVLDLADKIEKERTAQIDANTRSFEAREKHVRQLLTALENRPPAKPKVDLDTSQAEQARDSLVTSLNSLGPFYYDIIGRYSTQGSPSQGGGGGGGGPTEEEGNTAASRALGRPSITVPSVTIVEAADGKATAQEFLNRVVALSY